MLLIDNDNFVAYQPNNRSLCIIDINKLEPIKTIKDIDCNNSDNCLFKINNKYIIINCLKGIGLFHIKTQNLVQYVQEYSFLNNISQLCSDNEENIYLLYLDKNSNNDDNTNSINLNNYGIFGNNNNNKSLFGQSLYNNYKFKIIIVKIIEGSILKINIF